jgi:hypothetical protein
MKRKQLLFLGVALVISSSLITWFAFKGLNREPTYWVHLQGPRRLRLPVVNGQHGGTRPWVLGSSGTLPEWLSREDLDEIRRAIRHEMWHKGFPSVSWRTLQDLPHSLCLLATSRVQEVGPLVGSSAGVVQVRTRSHYGDYFFIVGRSRLLSNPLYPARPKRETILTEAAFSESLSNHATLTFGR